MQLTVQDTIVHSSSISQSSRIRCTYVHTLHELSKHGPRMGVIAKNTKDYISFSIKVEVGHHMDKDGIEIPIEVDLRFIDSYKFMSSSLDSLVNNLARGEHEFFSFNEYSEHQHQLLVRKGIYPYEYMYSWDRFEETSLPPASSFYSKLNMSGVSDEDYEHACKVWKEFNICNLGEYHDLYLRTDIILLANILESFRRVFLDNYGLDTFILHQDWLGKLV